MLHLRFRALYQSVYLCLEFLKTLSGTSPFMTTNISATFLDIAKGELCVCACLSLVCALGVVEKRLGFDILPCFSDQGDVSVHVSCG